MLELKPDKEGVHLETGGTFQCGSVRAQTVRGGSLQGGGPKEMAGSFHPEAQIR